MSNNNSGKVEELVAKHITEEMGKAYLVEESGYPGDAEERYYFDKEGGREYRAMIINRIVKDIEAYISSKVNEERSFAEFYMTNESRKKYRYHIKEHDKDSDRIKTLKETKLDQLSKEI